QRPRALVASASPEQLLERRVPGSPVPPTASVHDDARVDGEHAVARVDRIYLNRRCTEARGIDAPLGVVAEGGEPLFFDALAELGNRSGLIHGLGSFGLPGRQSSPAHATRTPLQKAMRPSMADAASFGSA